MSEERLNAGQLETLMDIYLDWVRLERGLSKNSITNYGLDIQKLVHFLSENNIKLLFCKILIKYSLSFRSFIPITFVILILL